MNLFSSAEMVWEIHMYIKLFRGRGYFRFFKIFRPQVPLTVPITYVKLQLYVYLNLVLGCGTLKVTG